MRKQLVGSRLFALCLGLMALTITGAVTGAFSAVRPGQLGVRVDEAAAMHVQGAGVMVQVRMNDGVVAQLWADSSCTSPREVLATFQANGTYMVTMHSYTPGSTLCLATSDNRIRAQVRLD